MAHHRRIADQFRGGAFYVLAGGSVKKLPSLAAGYEPAAPWPVAYHDNQRTGDAGPLALSVGREQFVLDTVVHKAQRTSSDRRREP